MLRQQAVPLGHAGTSNLPSCVVPFGSEAGPAREPQPLPTHGVWGRTHRYTQANPPTCSVSFSLATMPGPKKVWIFSSLQNRAVCVEGRSGRSKRSESSL